jgi:hypothetical protein
MATKQSRDRRAPYVPLDRVAVARREGRASLDALWLAMTATAPSNRAMIQRGRARPITRMNFAVKRYFILALFLFLP